MNVLKLVLLIIGGYLLGNFSSARALSRLKKDDITKHGSGNPGTMNMLRTYGIGFGILTLVLDALKGAIPALVGLLIFRGNPEWANIALFSGGFSAILGHVFPVFYKFKGGKGVACIVGMFAVCEPVWAAIMLGASFIYLLIFQYGALASFLFITVLTIIEGYKFRGNVVVRVLLAGIFFLTWFMHRGNFFRLLTGKENKVRLFKTKSKLKVERTKKISKRQIKKQKIRKEIG